MNEVIQNKDIYACPNCRKTVEQLEIEQCPYCNFNFVEGGVINSTTGENENYNKIKTTYEKIKNSNVVKSFKDNVEKSEFLKSVKEDIGNSKSLKLLKKRFKSAKEKIDKGSWE